MTSISISLTEYADNLWKEFHQINHEMTVTKPGRRIFPTLVYCISGLSPEKFYKFSLHFDPIGHKKHKNDVLALLLLKEENGEPKKIWHKDGEKNGIFWMSGNLDFSKVRVTKCPETAQKEFYALLHSQHCYIPVLTCYEGSEEVFRLRLDYTEFLCVCTYSNKAVAGLKAKENPYTPLNKRERPQNGSENAASIPLMSSFSSSQISVDSMVPGNKIEPKSVSNPSPSLLSVNENSSISTLPVKSEGLGHSISNILGSPNPFSSVLSVNPELVKTDPSIPKRKRSKPYQAPPMQSPLSVNSGSMISVEPIERRTPLPGYLIKNLLDFPVTKSDDISDSSTPKKMKLYRKVIRPVKPVYQKMAPNPLKLAPLGSLSVKPEVIEIDLTDEQSDQSTLSVDPITEQQLDPKMLFNPMITPTGSQSFLSVNPSLIPSPIFPFGFPFNPIMMPFLNPFIFQNIQSVVQSNDKENEPKTVE